MRKQELEQIATQRLAVLTCGKCGYEWLPRTWLVKMCPACKSRKWNDRPKPATKGKK